MITYDKNNEKAKLNIAYIGGGSRGWAWGLMNDLALEGRLSGQVRLYDIDHAAAENNKIIGDKMAGRDVAGKWEYVVAGSLKEALTDADVVVVSILPGTFDEMESDVHAPEKYGIYQPVGDTAGPGGLVRALRTVPMFEEIALAVRDYSPEAWVINYTNPMTVCTQTLYRVFPEIKAFGCCHEVFGAQHLLSRVLEEQAGITGIIREDLHTNVLGINHFTWIDRASYRGLDIMEMLKDYAPKYYENGTDPESVIGFFCCTNKVKLDLYRRYGILGAAGDRHLAEFVPGSWYLKSPEDAFSWGYTLTPVSWRKEELKERLARSARLVSGEEELNITPSGELGVRMIVALCGLEDLMTNVNVPNQGQMDGLARGGVVETNAYFTRDCVQPIFAGRLPNPVEAMVQRHMENHVGIIEAALHADYNLAFNVFLNDPKVDLPLDQARELFDTMLHNTSKYLPDGLER